MEKDTFDYLSEIDEPSDEELREVEQLLNPDKLKSESFDAGGGLCFDGDEKLLDFSRFATGHRMDNSQAQKTINIKIDDLNLSSRTVTLMETIGIYSVSDLISRTRAELKSLRFVGFKVVAEITEALLKYDLHLSGEELYICSKCGKKFSAEKTDSNEHYCNTCQERINRINEISDIKVMVSGPEYSSYTNMGEGFVLYANITNNTYNLRKIKVNDFYLVSEGQQRSPEYFYSGFMFIEETLMPMCSKSCAKIWSKKAMKKDKLSPNDYVIITLFSEAKNYMFKFVFDGEEWSIDDYFEQY